MLFWNLYILKSHHIFGLVLLDDGPDFLPFFCLKPFLLNIWIWNLLFFNSSKLKKYKCSHLFFELRFDNVELIWNVLNDSHKQFEDVSAEMNLTSEDFGKVFHNLLTMISFILFVFLNNMLRFVLFLNIIDVYGV